MWSNRVVFGAKGLGDRPAGHVIAFDEFHAVEPRKVFGFGE